MTSKAQAKVSMSGVGGRVSQAWDELGRFVDKGYAIAVSKRGKGRIHVRAVRQEEVVECECPTIEEAISTAYEKTRKSG